MPSKSPSTSSTNLDGRSLARAFWVVSPGQGEIRSEVLPALAHGGVRVRTLYSGISRGTEMLVWSGQVPASEHQRMRAPFQVGEFSGPLKYGYINVGIVEAGPAALVGREVFSLYPHQTRFDVPAAAVTPLPEGIPAGRAVLAANMETAVNALWDASPRIGDRICIVGAGTLGLLIARLAAQIPGCRVEVVDLLPSRADIVTRFGAHFALPADATPDADLVIHCSGHGAGLSTALCLAGFEATVLELSWYGSRRVEVPLGEAFHVRRLTLKSSQVGQLAAPQRARWTYPRRMATVLSLLSDPLLDLLITDTAPFDDLPGVMARLSAGAPDTLCQRIDYSDCA